MKIASLVPLLLSRLIPCVDAVYTDEAFVTDFHLALLGTPHSPLNTFFHRPSSTSPASLLYTLSNRCVLGAVNPKDGSLVWRQILQTQQDCDPSHCVLRKGSNGIIATGVNKEVSLWNAGSGKKIWENHFSQIIKDITILDTERIVVVAFSDGTVRALETISGDVKWEVMVGGKKDEPIRFSTTPHRVHLSLFESSTRKLKTVGISPTTGSIFETHFPGNLDSTDSFIYGPNSLPVAAWKDGKNVKVNLMETKNTVSAPVEDDVEVTLRASSVKGFVLGYTDRKSETLKSWAEVYEIDSTIKKTLDIPNISAHSCFSVSQSGEKMFVSRVMQDSIIIYETSSTQSLQTFKLSEPLASLPLQCISEVVKRADGSIAARTSMYLEDGSHILFRNGDVLWTREESLASAVAAEWVELHDMEEGLEHELHVEESKGVLGAYIHRVVRHINELQHLPAWIKDLPNRIMAAFGLGGRTQDVKVLKGDVRDAFGFRKFVVIITELGTALAIDTYNRGAVVWRLPLGVGEIKEADVKGLFTLRKGVVALVLKSRQVVEIDALAGKIINLDYLSGDGKVESASVVDSLTSEQKILVILPENDKLQGWVYPKDGEVTEISSSVHLTQRQKNGVRGVTPKVVTNGRFDILPSWNFAPPEPEVLSSLVTRPAHDPVASIGKVLGDRSVLYKYLNPHLLLAVTKDSAKSSISVYLLDSVSGALLHSQTHKSVDTSRSIVATMSENWFVVSFFSTSAARGYQLVVSELYASALKNDPGHMAITGNNMSSLDIPRSAAPHVVSQAYVFSHPITTMQTTSTRQGITTRSVLAYLPTIGSILAIPKRVLDPSRPVGREPNADEKEEGLFKYDPNIGVDYLRSVLSHNLDVYGTNHIMTSPSLLESTCIVLAWGLDIFGTRVAPSEPFDILGKSFNKIALIGTVAALAVGTSFLAPMVRRKQINQRWKQ